MKIYIYNIFYHKIFLKCCYLFLKKKKTLLVIQFYYWFIKFTYCFNLGYDNDFSIRTTDLNVRPWNNRLLQMAENMSGCLPLCKQLPQSVLIVKWVFGSPCIFLYKWKNIVTIVSKFGGIVLFNSLLLLLFWSFNLLRVLKMTRYCQKQVFQYLMFISI